MAAETEDWSGKSQKLNPMEKERGHTFFLFDSQAFLNHDPLSIRKCDGESLIATEGYAPG
jgi:hypothetical protein